MASCWQSAVLYTCFYQCPGLFSAPVFPAWRISPATRYCPPLHLLGRFARLSHSLSPRLSRSLPSLPSASSPVNHLAPHSPYVTRCLWKPLVSEAVMTAIFRKMGNSPVILCTVVCAVSTREVPCLSLVTRCWGYSSTQILDSLLFFSDITEPIRAPIDVWYKQKNSLSDILCNYMLRSLMTN